MTLEEIYTQQGAEYPTLLARNFGDAYVEKYLFKFIEDDHYQLLADAVSDKDYDTTCREAHTLKGMCLNLSLEKLGGECSDLVEYIRAGNTADVEMLYQVVQGGFEELKTAVKQL